MEQGTTKKQSRKQERLFLLLVGVVLFMLFMRLILDVEQTGILPMLTGG